MIVRRKIEGSDVLYHSSYAYVRRMPSDELYHHGVKGQSWGKRRYQNADGSLTPEGYAHYGYDKFSKHQKKQINELTNSGKKSKEKADLIKKMHKAGFGTDRYNKYQNKMEKKIIKKAEKTGRSVQEIAQKKTVGKANRGMASALAINAAGSTIAARIMAGGIMALKHAPGPAAKMIGLGIGAAAVTAAAARGRANLALKKTLRLADIRDKYAAKNGQQFKNGKFVEKKDASSKKSNKTYTEKDVMKGFDKEFKKGTLTAEEKELYKDLKKSN